MKARVIRGPAVVCPHCEGPTELRTSRSIAPLARDIYYRCRDDTCGHVFVAQLVVTHTVVPSARPNPAVELKVHAPVAAVPKPANDDVAPPTPANDDGDAAAEAIVTAPG